MRADTAKDVEVAGESERDKFTDTGGQWHEPQLCQSKVGRGAEARTGRRLVGVVQG